MRPSSIKIILAFAAMYFVWGSMYIAIAIVVRTLPPFAAGSIRFAIASTMLFVWLRSRDPQPFSGFDVKRAALVGVLSPGIGNGMIMWAQQGVPSGITALLAASLPVAVLLLDWLFFSRQTPKPRAIFGMLIALVGVTVIVSHTRSLSGAVRPIHLAAVLTAVLTWSIGTLLQKNSRVKERFASFACVQMASSCVLQFGLATVSGEWTRFAPAQASWQSLVALCYLIVFGSLITTLANAWLLTHVSAQKTTTYALVNPVVAMILGALILHERITTSAVLAAVLVLAGVGLVLFQRAPKLIAKNADAQPAG